MKLSCSNIKKVLIFFSKENFSYISKNRTLPKTKQNKKIHSKKKFHISQGMDICDSKIEKLLIFLEIKPCTFSFSPSSRNKKVHPKKISDASGNRNP